MDTIIKSYNSITPCQKALRYYPRPFKDILYTLCTNYIELPPNSFLLINVVQSYALTIRFTPKKSSYSKLETSKNFTLFRSIEYKINNNITFQAPPHHKKLIKYVIII